MVPSAESRSPFRYSRGSDHTAPMLESNWKQIAPASPRASSFRGKWNGCLTPCCASASERCQLCYIPGGHLPKGRKKILDSAPRGHRTGPCMPCDFAKSATHRDSGPYYSESACRTAEWQQCKSQPYKSTNELEHEKRFLEQHQGRGDCLPQIQAVDPLPATNQQGLVHQVQHESDRHVGRGRAQKDQFQIVTLLISPSDTDLLQSLLGLFSGSVKPGAEYRREPDHVIGGERRHTLKQFAGAVPSQPLGKTGGAFQPRAIRVDDLAKHRGTLQAILYNHAESVFSVAELHLLRHMLCLERTGPLADGEVALLRALTSRWSAEPLSPCEHKSLIGLLRHRGNEAVRKEGAQALRTLLLKALACSLSFEQQQNAKALLQDKPIAPFSPGVIEHLYRVLNEHPSAGDDLGRKEVQGAIEEQLKSHCSSPQQLAIHRLLFMEEPWPLSPEQRQILETLQAQPAKWWFPEQQVRYFECMTQAHTPEAPFTGVSEAARLLLQLMNAALTPGQSEHLCAILGMAVKPGNAEASQQQTASTGLSQPVTPISQVRLMSLIRRSLKRVALAPAESRELQNGIAQQLFRLMPEGQVRTLQSLILLDDRSPRSDAAYEVLKELQTEHETLKAGGEASICADELNRSGLRKAFLYCLALSLSPEQLSLLNRMLQQDRKHPHASRHEASEGRGDQQQHSAARLPEFYGRHGFTSDSMERMQEHSPSGGPQVWNAEADVHNVSSTLQIPSGSILTGDQLELLKRFLQLHSLGCAEKQDDLLRKVLGRRSCRPGPVSYERLHPLHQLLFHQLSMSFYQAQLQLIEEIIANCRSPASQTSIQCCASTKRLDPKNVALRDGEPLPFQDELPPFTAGQRRLLEWLVGQRNSEVLRRDQKAQSLQFGMRLKGEGPAEELQAFRQHLLLRRLASSLTTAQLDMISCLLGREWTLTGQSIPATGEALELLKYMDKDPKAGSTGLRGATQSTEDITIGESAKTDEFERLPESYRVCGQTTTDAVSRERSGEPSLPGVEDGASQSELPTLLRLLQSGEATWVTPMMAGGLQSQQDKESTHPKSHSESGEFPSGLKLPAQHELLGGTQISVTKEERCRGCVDGTQLGTLTGKNVGASGSQMGEHAMVFDGSSLIEANEPTSSICTGEDLESKRVLLQRLVLEATDRKMFCDDLESWRHRYRQRAELHEVLKVRLETTRLRSLGRWSALGANILSISGMHAMLAVPGLELLPFIAKIQELQKGYLKRCPCLYHQQQDQREAEMRQANLELLNTLGSFVCRPRKTQTMGEPSLACSTSLEGSIHSDDLRDLEDYPVERSMTEESTSPARHFTADVTSTPFRGSSLPLSLPSEHYRPKVQMSQERFGVSSNSGPMQSSVEMAKAPMHTQSLDAATRASYGGGTVPTITPFGRLSRESIARHRHGLGREQGFRFPRVAPSTGSVQGEQEVAMEERKRAMQKEALKKAQQLKEDARIASWIVLKKQMRPDEPSAGLDLVDKINLSHLNAKTLPRGKGWQTRSLIGMVEGLVALVCTHGKTEAASVLAPLLVLANQTRAEDCDLAIHAEAESARRALVRLNSSPTLGLEKKQAEVANFPEAGKTAERAHQTGASSEKEISAAEKDEVGGAHKEVVGAAVDATLQGARRAPRESKKKGHPKPHKSADKTMKKPTPTDLSGKFKEAALIEKGTRRGKALARAPVSSPPIMKSTLQGNPQALEGQQSESQTQPDLSETSRGSSRTSSQSPWTLSSSKESQPKQLRVRRTAEFIAALEAKAVEVMQRRLRSRPFRGHYKRGRSEPGVMQSRPDRLYTPGDTLRKCASDDENSPALKRLVRCNLEPGGRQNSGQLLKDMLQLPPDVPFIVLREKLKHWMLAEGPGLELAKGKKMSYKEWMRLYYGHKKGEGLSSSQPPPPSRRKDRVPMVAVRLNRASQAVQPASEQSVQIPEDGLRRAG